MATLWLKGSSQFSRPRPQKTIRWLAPGARDESSRLEKKWKFKDVRVSHKKWILTVFIPDRSLNYISMCKGELRALCLKPTTTKRQKDRHFMRQSCMEQSLCWLPGNWSVFANHVQLGQQWSSPVGLPHQGTESEAGSAVENLNKERVSFKICHPDM